MIIGFDTSNYTTSVAACDGLRVENCSRLLKVRAGELGLRQSDALFLHIQNLPELEQELFDKTGKQNIEAVCVSTRPRAVEGSYMPCFLAGRTSAFGLAAALRIPLYEVSHQQGHLAAVLYSANRMDLLTKHFLAWHLSGGTTELLLVDSSESLLHCEKIGGTTDISAGQLIDRTGLRLELNFPAGREIDSLASCVSKPDSFRVKLQGLSFSFSGVENQMQRYAALHSKEETAAFVLSTVCTCISSVTKEAEKQYGKLPVVFSGGVASNSMLRAKMNRPDNIFGEPRYSTDNAAGVAVLGSYLKEHYGL